MWITLVLVLNHFAVSIAEAPQDTHATHDAIFCAWMFIDGCDFGDHILQGPSPGGYDGQEAHGDCRTCIEELPCHSGCSLPQANAELQEAYDRALAAAEQGNSVELLELIAAVPEFIRINGERAAIQFYACDGESVIASLPLPTS
jgi:hypothetical protein